MRRKGSGGSGQVLRAHGLEIKAKVRVKVRVSGLLTFLGVVVELERGREVQDAAVVEAMQRLIR